MRIHYKILALLLLVQAAVAQSTLPQLREDVRQAAPKGIPAYSPTVEIRNKAKRQLDEKRRVLRFAKLWPVDSACVKDPDRIVSVKSDADWPPDAGAIFLVVLDESGRPSALLEEPTSCSGDWANEYIHYFDASGRTVAYERHSGFFNGCDFGTASETAVTYYGPTGFVIAREYQLADAHGKEHAAAKCQFMYRYPYVVHRDWTSAAKAYGLPRTVSQ